LKPLTFNGRIVLKNNEPAPSWFRWGRPTSQTFKKTAPTWKVKYKATSQLARCDARHAVSGVNQGGQGETSSPKVWLPGDSSVDSSQSSDLGGTVPGLALWDLIKGISHFIILMQSVLSSSSTYMTIVGSRGAGLPYKNIIRNSYLFILKQWYMHTYLHTTVCVCMDTYMYTCWNIIKQLLNSKGDAGLPNIFWLIALKLKMPTL